MEFTTGAVLDGKVKSITNFGAFIALPENKTGLVHISEVSNTYVSDVRQHLTEGQDVKVLVIGNENGKLNLSIKRLEAKPQREVRPAKVTPPPAPKTADQLFEEKLKAFMSESDSKISSFAPWQTTAPAAAGDNCRLCRHRYSSRWELRYALCARYVLCTRYVLRTCWSYIISKREALYRICAANISILRSKNIDKKHPKIATPLCGSQ